MPETAEKLECSNCHREFSSKLSLGLHRSKVHGIRGPNYKYNKAYHDRKVGKSNKDKSIVKVRPVHAEEERAIEEAAEGHKLSNHFACAFGIVQSKLETYAANNAIPYSILAEGVATLLRGKTSR